MLMMSSKNLRRRSPMTPATIIETVVSQGWFGFGRRVDRCLRSRLLCSPERRRRSRPAYLWRGRPASLRAASARGCLVPEATPRQRRPRSRRALPRATSIEAASFEATQLDGPRCSPGHLARGHLVRGHPAQWASLLDVISPKAGLARGHMARGCLVQEAISLEAGVASGNLARGSLWNKAASSEAARSKPASGKVTSSEAGH